MPPGSDRRFLLVTSGILSPPVWKTRPVFCPEVAVVVAVPDLPVVPVVTGRVLRPVFYLQPAVPEVGDAALLPVVLDLVPLSSGEV